MRELMLLSATLAGPARPPRERHVAVLEARIELREITPLVGAAALVRVSALRRSAAQADRVGEQNAQAAASRSMPAYLQSASRWPE